jgi:hypothetical protein
VSPSAVKNAARSAAGEVASLVAGPRLVTPVTIGQ